MDAKDIRPDAEYWTFDVSTYEVLPVVLVGQIRGAFCFVGPRTGPDGPAVLELDPCLVHADRAGAEAAAVRFAGFQAVAYRSLLNRARAALGLAPVPPDDDDDDEDEDDDTDEIGAPVGHLEPAGASAAGPAYHAAQTPVRSVEDRLTELIGYPPLRVEGKP